MKNAFTAIAIVLACGGALAQAPAGVLQTPSAQQDPTRSGGKAQMTGEMRAEARMDPKSMDANGDGMISSKEWNDFHAKVWKSMKADKGGMVKWEAVNGAMGGMYGTPK